MYKCFAFLDLPIWNWRHIWGIQLYLKDLKKQKPKNKNKKILYPGEIEKITEKKRKSNGIPFDKELRVNFSIIAEKYKVKFNL